MSVPPTGRVTFLFTDIEGSTRMWERSPEAMSQALARHDRILRDTIEGHDGHVFKTVGDAFCAAFGSATEAVRAGLLAQSGLLAEGWPEEVGALRVRMALHTGNAEERGGDYFGPPVNRVARLLSAGHGGQVLLSRAAQELVRDRLPEGASLRDLGERRLKDLFGPERVFQILAPDLPGGFPPLKTLDARRNNLPVQPNPLVGRGREAGDVAGLLRQEGVRLLTLLGPGGTGKTRLGLQVAADLVDEFEDGVFFVALAPVRDPGLVASTIAGPLGVTENPEQPLTESLKNYLSPREMLLLLDNFEQVVGAAPLVGELLSSCPKLRVLATSRAALRVYGEREYPVPPLALPDPGKPSSPEILARYEAVRLFVERAGAVRPGFGLTNENAPAVAEICVRLDGLPLAIELAAARAKILAPEAMLSRLGDRLKLLRGGARDLPARQQTLRGAIDWSHELLDEEERALFRRLSVFVGDFALDAAEETCDAGGDLLPDVLDGVGSLVDKSLLRQGEGPGGEPRFFMLETVREYALERLAESGEAGEVQRLHATHFLTLAEEAEPRLKGPESAGWLERLESEHGNLRAALSWALESDETGLAPRLAGALWWFWFDRGHSGEGRRWLEETLAKGARIPAAGRVRLLGGVAWLAMTSGDLERGMAASEEGMRLSRLEDIGGGEAAFLRITGGIAANELGDTAKATGLLEEGLALSREAGDGWGLALSILNLGSVASNHEDHERAAVLYEEGLALSRELGEPALLAAYLINLGYDSLLRGDAGLAAARSEEAAALLRERGVGAGLELALDNLGWAALLQGDHERASDLYAQSLTLAQKLGNKVSTVESVEGLACAAGASGNARRAARLLGAAQALREALGFYQPPAARALREPYLAAARSGLDEAEWGREWEEGRTMTQEEAVALALEGSDGVAERARGTATT